jgi:hypothetical protein
MARLEPLPRNRSLLVVHALQAADYSLGSPDFATPALTQTHVLRADAYTLQPPDFDQRALSQNHRLEPQRRRTGRRPAIPTEAVRDMLIGQMAEWLREKQAKTRRRLGPGDREVEAHAHWLAGRAGVSASYDILKKQVVRPAFKIIRVASGRDLSPTQ